MGDNSGDHAFLGKISRYGNHFALHQAKVQFLHPFLSYTLWLWQKRLDSGPGDDNSALVHGFSGRGGKMGSDLKVKLRICRLIGFGVDEKEISKK